jgi:hypothetical protein
MPPATDRGEINRANAEQLRDLQKTRRAQQQQELDRCVELMQLHESKG